MVPYQKHVRLAGRVLPPGFSRILTALVAGVVMVSPSVAGTDSDPSIAQAEILPSAGGGEAPVLRFHIPSGFQGSARVMIPLGEVVLGELSPSTGLDWRAGNITILITSGTGVFPPYRLWGRTLTPLDPTPGQYNTRDVGMGIRSIVARNPVVNATYDYDPATVAKNVDGEPTFLGTLATLGLAAPGTLLYRTRGTMFAATNQFTLRFASAPQFYTPATTFMQIELTLSVP